MLLPQADIDNFVKIINNNQSFVLTCHTNPDGDALGSTLALCKALNNIGKSATVITPDLAPSFYSWMPGFKTLHTYERETEDCDKLIDAADAILIMDYNDLKRVKTLGEKITSVAHKHLIMIDHHLDPLIDPEVKFSYPEASATCELVYNILKAAQLTNAIDVEVAQNIYTGIITDTGGLSYNSSTPDLYLTVAELLRIGIDKPAIHEKIFNNKTIRRLKLLGYTLSHKLHRIEKYPLAIMTLNAKELEQYNYNTGDTEGFVNYPLQVKDVIATAFIMERPDGVKISMRSKGEFPVNDFLAQQFNGGGHKNAAGANFNGPLEEAVERYTQNIVPYYAKWLKAQTK